MNKNYFLSQPHQPFFIAGIFWAIVSMSFFAFMYHGAIIVNINPLFFHVYTMLFMIFTPFFIGFIFTTFPRFCQSSVIDKEAYIFIFFLLEFGSILFVIGAFVNPILLDTAIFIMLISHLLVILELQKIYQERQISKASSDTLWILIGFYIGLFVHTLFFIEVFLSILPYNISIFNIAATIGFWNYLIFVVFSIAQKMVPFFSHVTANKRRGFVSIVFTAFLLQSLFVLLDFRLGWIVIDVTLAIYILNEYRRWKLNTFNAPAILWILHLALYWFAISLIFSIVSVNFLTLHLMAIGFLTTMLIGFGTRVTLGHSGQTPQADYYTIYLFYFLQVIVLLRAAFSFWNEKLWIFDISAAAWVVLYILWASRYGSILLYGKKERIS